jgi:hypothetical protein
MFKNSGWGKAAITFESCVNKIFAGGGIPLFTSPFLSQMFCEMVS